MIRFSNLANLPGVKKAVIVHDLPVEHVFTDSRKPIIHQSSLFFAITGDVHDGHEFINELYRSGIRLFIISLNPDPFTANCPDASFIQVEDPILFLQEITAYKKSFYKIRSIGITGSNGKTIVKEWLSKILSRKFSVLKSPGSYNSQIGVSLSVWPIDSYHEIGVFEAGISRKGEMTRLEKIIQPEIGIFTNIGPAHDMGFKNRNEKILEKLELFKNSKTIICSSNHPDLYNQIKNHTVGAQIISWGHHESDSIRIMKIIKQEKYTSIEIKTAEKSAFIHIPFMDEASIENSMHILTILWYLKWSWEEIRRELDTLDEIPMRLELKKGINNCYVIDDSYNNDLAGLEIALNFQTSQIHKKKKTLVLSDILQSGLAGHELYAAVGKLLARYNLSKVYAIGTDIHLLQDFYTEQSEFYYSTEEFLNAFDPANYKDEIILIKGARIFRFEKIVKLLQEKIHGTVLEINLDHVSHNLNVFRRMLPIHTRIMVMVKALAYGSGSLEIANLMQYHRVDYLGVAYTDEGVFLRTNGISIPIMVMNPSKQNFENLIRFRLEPEIYSFKILKEFGTYLEETGQTARIHIKLDTGMHRLGFDINDLNTLIEKLTENKNIEVASVFSHFAAADDPADDAFTIQQAELFTQAAAKLADALNIDPIRHICNTAGLVRFPEFHMDMIRLGIGLYGFDMGLDTLKSLIPISTLKTEISQIKALAKGESVGYNRAGVTNHTTMIATIAIGYADGFPRAFSNGRISVYVNGKMAPVIGNVCMDMTMIDVTGIEVKEGDYAIIFGKDLPLQQVAKAIDTIPYEILTGISDRVKRVFYSS